MNKFRQMPMKINAATEIGRRFVERKRGKKS